MALDLKFLDQAATTDTVAANGAPLMVSIDLIDEDPDNPRTEFGNFSEFAEDIKARGILQPLVVRSPGNGRYVIRFGARRFRGAKLAGLREVPIFIAADPRQFDDYSQVAENRQRAPLSPLEEAAFIQKRLNAGDKRKDIAAKMQISASAITALLALIDPPQFIVELYQSGRCTIPDYFYRLRQLHGTKPDVVETAIASAEEITRKFIDELAVIVNGVVKPPTAPVAPSGGAGDGEPPERPGTPPKPPVIAPKTRYNVVLVKHGERSAQLLLDRPATTIGLGWIKYQDDTTESEVVLTDCTLDALLEK